MASARSRVGALTLGGAEALAVSEEEEHSMMRLAAQAVLLDSPEDEAVIATTNVGHLGRYARAQRWEEIL